MLVQNDVRHELVERKSLLIENTENKSQVFKNMQLGKTKASTIHALAKFVTCNVALLSKKIYERNKISNKKVLGTNVCLWQKNIYYAGKTKAVVPTEIKTRKLKITHLKYLLFIKQRKTKNERDEAKTRLLFGKKWLWVIPYIKIYQIVAVVVSPEVLMWEWEITLRLIR